MHRAVSRSFRAAVPLVLVQRGAHPVEVGEVGAETTFGDRPYFAITAALVWHLPHSSGVAFPRGRRGPAMSCAWWQSVHTGTSALPSRERAAVHAAHIGGRDALVALRARLRHGLATHRGLFDVMRAMTVDAQRRGSIAARNRLLVHAVERLGVIGEVAAAALRWLRVRGVTVGARKLRVDGLGYGLGRVGLPPGQSQHDENRKEHPDLRYESGSSNSNAIARLRGLQDESLQHVTASRLRELPESRPVPAATAG